MHQSHRIITAVCLLASATAAYLSAAEFLPGHQCRCPHCQVVEEVVYQDCVTHKCELHPDKKTTKKTVYEIKEVPFCLHKLTCPLHKHGCDCCVPCKECECQARYKKVLIKKEVVVCEECTTKCTPVPVVTRVAVKVQRVIPCANCARQGCAGGVPSMPGQTAPVQMQLPTPPVDDARFSELVAPVQVR